MKIVIALASLLAVMAAATIILRQHHHWTAWLISAALLWIWYKAWVVGYERGS